MSYKHSFEYNIFEEQIDITSKILKEVKDRPEFDGKIILID